MPARPHRDHPGMFWRPRAQVLPVPAVWQAEPPCFQPGWRRKEALQKPALGYGMHLTLDGYDCNPQHLANLDLIYEFLDRCPDLIQMTKIMPPYVFKYQAPVPEEWGISGFVLIAESHISIHTYPEKAYLSVDIFSCRDFDHQKAVTFIRDTFGVGRYELNLLNRGLEYPREAKQVEHLLRQERQNLRI